MQRSSAEEEKWALLGELRSHKEARMQLQQKAEELMKEAAKVRARHKLECMHSSFTACIAARVHALQLEWRSTADSVLVS